MTDALHAIGNYMHMQTIATFVFAGVLLLFCIVTIWEHFKGTNDDFVANFLADYQPPKLYDHEADTPDMTPEVYVHGRGER